MVGGAGARRRVRSGLSKGLALTALDVGGEDAATVGAVVGIGRAGVDVGRVIVDLAGGGDGATLDWVMGRGALATT